MATTNDNQQPENGCTSDQRVAPMVEEWLHWWPEEYQQRITLW